MIYLFTNFYNLFFFFQFEWLKIIFGYDEYMLFYPLANDFILEYIQ